VPHTGRKDVIPKMNVADVSMSTGLASLASQMGADRVGAQITIAVLKQIQDQQKMQADALIQMMQQSQIPVSDGVSQYVDTYA
jgi:hypothetical protein